MSIKKTSDIQSGSRQNSLDRQVRLYTSEGLRLGHPIEFSPAKYKQALLYLGKTNPNLQIYAYDVGGDKIARQIFTINTQVAEPLLMTVKGSELVKSGVKNGAGYAEILGQTPFDALVGISFAGPLRGGEPIAAPNMGRLLTDIRNSALGHKGTLQTLVPGGIEAINDAPAALIAEIIRVEHEVPMAESIVFGINGGGTGGCIAQKSENGVWTIIPLEPGHISLDESLAKILGYTPAICNIEPGLREPCIENITGGAAGIAKAWEAQNAVLGTPQDKRAAKEIIELAFNNEVSNNDSNKRRAAHLIENAQDGFACVLIGMTLASKLDPEKTVFILHGGTLKSQPFEDGIRLRVWRFFEDHNLPVSKHFINTKSEAVNPGLTGAAIYAVLKTA